MKKIILTGVALMVFAAASFAQNTATYSAVGTSQSNNQTQTGNNHTSTVTQGSGSNTTINTYNTSETNQSGQYHSATVLQDGNADYNRAGITQTGGGATTALGNQATITQTQNSGGTGARGNGAAPAGDGNWAGILQAGAGNKNTSILQSNVSKQNFAEIYQYGTNNGTQQNGGNLGGLVVQPPQTLIEQSDNSTNNRATINQGSSGSPVSKNSATIRQLKSTDSQAIVDQLSSENYVNIRQVGVNNQSYATQQGGTNNSVESQALGKNNQETLMQTGANNQIYIRFEPENSTNLAQAVNNDNVINMTQNGNNNRSVADLRASQSNITLNQTGNGGSGSSYANYSRFQVGADNQTPPTAVGTNNDLTINQNRTINGSGTSANVFNSIVMGNNNNAVIAQTGEGNTIGGDGTTERGLAITGSSNDVDINQNGRDNSVNIGINGGAAGAGNEVDIVQTGNNNRVGTGAEGGSTVTNTSVRGLYVTGNSNKVDITQDGGDETKATQDGNDKLVVKQQNGIATAATQSNRVLISQGAGIQDADITQNGAGNFVYGLGGSGTFAEQKGGNPNKATVNQTHTAVNGATNELRLSQTSTGALNTATVTQIANLSSNLGIVNQTGSGNSATLNQTNN